jgi:CheY-like chemotaxis protein
MRVVIVEDNEPTAYLVKKAFSYKSDSVNWDLCFVKDGEEALDCIFHRGKHSEAALPDLVLLDWNLPKISGHEVLRTMKTNAALRTIPVLVFSASQADVDVQTAYNTHANGYIHKPSDLHQYYAIIDSIKSFWVNTARLCQIPDNRPPAVNGSNKKGFD